MKQPKIEVIFFFTLRNCLDRYHQDCQNKCVLDYCKNRVSHTRHACLLCSDVLLTHESFSFADATTAATYRFCKSLSEGPPPSIAHH